jgi:hypothetical protein
VCRTASGGEKRFYVLQFPESVDDGEAGGLAAKMRERLGEGQPEMGELPPLLTFEFTDEEREEIGEAIAMTDAAKRMTEECASADRPDTCGRKPKQGITWKRFWDQFFNIRKPTCDDGWNGREYTTSCD